MLKKLIFLLLFALFAIFSALILSPSAETFAQTVTATPVGTAAGSTSNVQIFFVACDTRAVVNFNGTMQSGYDVYYQVFNGAGGTGTAITALRRVNVSGNYAFSEVVNYNTGTTIAAGGTASVLVLMARESDSSRRLYETTVNDLQDGCAEPQNTVGTSVDSGDASADSDTLDTTQIQSPSGNVLNEGYTPKAEELVVIGARDIFPPRMSNPGLVFAECDDYPSANPGLIYDTDNVVVFWSWFAKTPEQVQQHIDNVRYEIGYFGSNPLPNLSRSEITQRGGDYWVFYTATLGRVKPDTYRIGYGVRWNNPITDGYDNFGPGTANETLTSSCTFTVYPNPDKQKVSYNFP